MTPEPSPLPAAPDALDRARKPLLPAPSRDLMRTAARLALATAYRSLQPTSRERFAREPERPMLRRLYYRTEDGWQAPLFRLAPCPGGPGEPVVLAHGLGVNRHSLDYGGPLSLGRALSAAGFEVFLLEHRGDRSAIAPPSAPPFDFDDIVHQDLPAALGRVLEETGFARALMVGHGLGGQAIYGALAVSRGAELAAATTICAPARFPRPRTTATALALARQLIPPGLTLPTRAAAALMAPSARAEGAGGLASAALPGEVARGLLLHGTEDLSGALLRQILLWLERGSLCDRGDRLDYVAALAGLDTPLQIVCAEGDPLCRPAQAEAALGPLAGPTEVLRLGEQWGHLDPLLSTEAPQAVFPAVVAWLERWRRRCW
ncbi:MAG: alpha/beta hydrolase [Alphaproteobacteria bacterium]|nr:alpha/beta hydrolase [Alphaproteobacteria bacterium]